VRTVRNMVAGYWVFGTARSAAETKPLCYQQKFIECRFDSHQDQGFAKPTRRPLDVRHRHLMGRIDRYVQ
jgi:hypothetical protein